jgi:hypothetical protein
MAELKDNTLTSDSYGDNRTKRRASEEPDFFDCEIQTTKRRKKIPVTTGLINTRNAVSLTTGSHQSSVLEIPYPTDTLSQLSSKLSSIVEVIVAGKSIAVATAFSAAPVQERTASKAAAAQMTPIEMDSWTAFTDGTCHLPEIDWDSCLSPAPTSFACAHVFRLRPRL